MNFKTLYWQGDINGSLIILDQRRLPVECEYITCDNVDQVYDAIKTLAVRGAPAIGVAAAYGFCIQAKNLDSHLHLHEALDILKLGGEYLASSRPTAVNLFWALERMCGCCEKFVSENQDADISSLQMALLAEANRICQEDVEMCRQIGINGSGLIEDGFCILTHCNAGALATAGIGTALAPMYTAKENGVNFTVFADETRPLGQGSRLTAWELGQAGIDVTIICDNMAGMLMSRKKIDMVIVGADRIAANGDAANKIGTYSLSVLARYHKIPFYIAAPSSTFDLSIADGAAIPIEQRDADEVRCVRTVPTAPADAKVYNPAFDVTPADHITAIITEKGIIAQPTTDAIRKLLR